MKNSISLVLLVIVLFFSACNGGPKPTQSEEKHSIFTGAKGEVKLMTLDPGHFHAALIQKIMYEQVNPVVDVTTHLVDLIQWEAFPNEILSKDDVEIVSAKRWATDLTPGMFKKVTYLEEYPEYLQKDVEDGILKVYSSGEINYKLKGIHAKTSVIWNYQAPEGTADTHYSIMRGTKCDLIIAQGEKEGYKSKLYIEATGEDDLTLYLDKAVQDLSSTYPGIELEKIEVKKWTLNIPDKYKVGHEAHFGQVAEKYLGYLKDGKLPEWEVPNMITKYYTTTKALEMAR